MYKNINKIIQTYNSFYYKINRNELKNSIQIDYKKKKNKKTKFINISNNIKLDQ